MGDYQDRGSGRMSGILINTLFCSGIFISLIFWAVVGFLVFG